MATKKATKMTQKKSNRPQPREGAHARSSTDAIIQRAREARASVASSSSGYFKMKSDRVKVRLIPFEHDGEVELWVPTGGYFNLPGHKFVPWTGPECPIAKILERYPGPAREAQYRLTRRVAVNIVDRGDKEQRCQIWEMPASISEAIEAYLDEPDYGERCFNLDKGHDFIVTKEGSGIDTEYQVIVAASLNRCRPTDDPIDIIARIEGRDIPDLDEIAAAIEEEFLR